MLPKRGYIILRVKFHALFRFAGFFLLFWNHVSIWYLKWALMCREVHAFIGADYSRTSRMYDIQEG